MSCVIWTVAVTVPDAKLEDALQRIFVLETLVTAQVELPSVTVTRDSISPKPAPRIVTTPASFVTDVIDGVAVIIRTLAALPRP